MTHRATHHTTAAAMSHSAALAWVNIGLIAIAVACLLSYVVAANSLAAQSWRFSDARTELSALLEARNSLVAQQSALEDREVLTALATNVGMIAAGTPQHLIQHQPVAAR